MTDCIHYNAWYKYQLTENYYVDTGCKPTKLYPTRYLDLTKTGVLCICRGYAWDGPSGPVIDTAAKLRASLVHDALYQLMRLGLLGQEHREAADRLFADICIEDGLPRWRAWIYYQALRRFGAGAADPDNSKPVLTAGRGCG